MKTLITILLILFSKILPATPTYFLKASSLQFISSNSVTFDLYLQNTGTEVFRYPWGQFMFNFSPDFANGGELTLSIEKSLLATVNAQIVGNQIRIFQLSDLQLGGYEISRNSPGTCLMKIKLSTTAQNFGNTMDLQYRNGLPNPYTKIFAVINSLAVDVTDSNMHFIDFTSWVNGNASIEPSDFSLEQNFPNPFNSSTIIGFSVPFKTRVILSVYDILGKLISTPIDAEVEKGSYEKMITLDQANSGIYFYRLQINDADITKQMLLIK